jgi:hypothetical protein
MTKLLKTGFSTTIGVVEFLIKFGIFCIQVLQFIKISERQF